MVSQPEQSREWYLNKAVLRRVLNLKVKGNPPLELDTLAKGSLLSHAFQTPSLQSSRSSTLLDFSMNSSAPLFGPEVSSEACGSERFAGTVSVC